MAPVPWPCRSRSLIETFLTAIPREYSMNLLTYGGARSLCDSWVSCTCDRGLSVGPPLMALQYIMYFRFCGWRLFSHNGANGSQPKTSCFVQFARWRHRGRSLPSRTASYWVTVTVSVCTSRPHCVGMHHCMLLYYPRAVAFESVIVVMLAYCLYFCCCCSYC